MIQRSMGRRWRSIVVPLALFRLTGQAAEFVGWMLFARTLGTSGFGEVSVVFLLCRYAGVVADFGATYRGSRDIVTAGRFGAVLAFVRLRTWLAIGLAALIAPVLAFSGHAYLAPLSLVSLALGLNRDWVALGLERGARAGLTASVQGAAILASALFVSSPGAVAMSVGVCYAVAAIMSVILNPLPAESNDARGRIKGWALLAVLAAQITASTDTVLLGILGSVSAAGIYAAVYRLPNAFIAILTILLSSLVPIATTSRVDRGDFHDAFFGQAIRTSTIGAGIVTLAAPLAVYATPTLFGPDYAAGRAPLAILMLATAIIVWTAPLHAFAVASGHARAVVGHSQG